MSDKIYNSFYNVQNPIPFMIYFDEESITVEPLSVLYDVYRCVDVPISNIGKKIPYVSNASNQAIYLECDLNTNYSILSAKINIYQFNNYPYPEDIYSGNSTLKNFKITKLRKLIAKFSDITLPNGKKFRYIDSLIACHLMTKVIAYTGDDGQGDNYGISLVPMYV